MFIFFFLSRSIDIFFLVSPQEKHLFMLCVVIRISSLSLSFHHMTVPVLTLPEEFESHFFVLFF